MILFVNIILFVFLIFAGCQQNKSNDLTAERYEIKLTNLSDSLYPDNPDIGFRAENYDCDYVSNISFEVQDSSVLKVDMNFFAGDSDTIRFNNIDVSELIPTIPNQLKEQEYLRYIACINQEWNRNQIRFHDKEFQSNNDRFTRIDIARNCLNAYLWEVIFYVQEGDQELPYAHSWFEFPAALYADFFELKNGIPFENFQQALENWVDPASEKIEWNHLRNVLDSVSISYKDLSNSMYPLEGARKKKFKEIIYPVTFSTMKDLQTDAALFATFTAPGFYNRNDPRRTELGRIFNLEKAELLKTKNQLNGSEHHELRLVFRHKNDTTKTQLIFGGLNLNEFPVLDVSQANKGWKNSMGISNHSFYEAYEDHLAIQSVNNPYYGIIVDERDQWLDSHKIGIDGPIFHFSDADRNELHLWLLSFERHALVGHYVFLIEEASI